MAPSDAAIEPPTARAEERWRKSRREEGVFVGDSTDMGDSGGTGRKEGEMEGHRERRPVQSTQYGVLSTEYAVFRPLTTAGSSITLPSQSTPSPSSNRRSTDATRDCRPHRPPRRR